MSELVKALTTLKIGDRVAMANTEVLAVPGGWIFTTTHNDSMTSCFVPLPANQVAMHQSQPKIALPH
jgi:hypothetical protein